MQVLYHASPNKQLTVIKPRKTMSRNAHIGDFVFATSDVRLAAMYHATKGNAILMNVKTKKPTVVICNNPEDYLSKDKGGAIYTVPVSTFRKSPQEGLEDSEMVSDVGVTPTNKQAYKSSLAAMKEMRITIYFVNEKLFNKLVEAKDESKILSKLEPYLLAT